MYGNLLQKMVQVCRDLSGQANTVNLLHGQQSHTNANKGTNETGQKRFFGSSFVALEAVGGLPEHKGIIHGLFFFFLFGWSSPVNILLSSEVCDEYKVK